MRVGEDEHPLLHGDEDSDEERESPTSPRQGGDSRDDVVVVPHWTGTSYLSMSSLLALRSFSLIFG